MGEVLDVDTAGRRCCVRYLREKMATWVEASRVSVPPPQSADAPSERPSEGAWVEVAFKGDDGVTEAWWEGQVMKVKGDFAYITFAGVGGLKSQEVVELDRVRPAQGHAPARLDKRHFPLSSQLKAGASIISQQAARIAALSGLLRLAVTPDANDIIAIGTPGALETSTALINMMLLKVPHLMAAEARSKMLQTRVGALQPGDGTAVSSRED